MPFIIVKRLVGIFQPNTGVIWFVELSLAICERLNGNIVVAYNLPRKEIRNEIFGHH